MTRHYCFCCDNRSAVQMLSVTSFVASAVFLIVALSLIFHAESAVGTGFFILAALQALFGWLLYAGVTQEKDDLLLVWLIFAATGYALVALTAHIALSIIVARMVKVMTGYCIRCLINKSDANFVGGVVVMLYVILAIQIWVFLLVRSVRRDIVKQRRVQLSVHA